MARLMAAPMSPAQLCYAGIALVALGTLYCQIYCAIAFQPIHGPYMAARYSIAWAMAAILPWLACFELCKRAGLTIRPPAARYLAMAGWFAAAAGLSIILERALDQLLWNHHTRPVPMQIAVQMPAAALAGFLLVLGRTAARSAPPQDRLAAEPLAEVMAIAPAIDWVEAAGNYAQVHAGGRTSLHRVTMRELEASLGRSAFARIHRSVIVRIAAVEARVLVGGSPAVRLRDGTVLKVGSRYAGNLERLAA